MVRSPDGDTGFFDIVDGVLQGDTLASYLFIIFIDSVLRTSVDLIKENKTARNRRYPAETMSASCKYTCPGWVPVA